MLALKVVRLHIAHRSAIAERLKYAGMTQETAEAALTAWEALADAELRPRGRAAFWEGCEAWCLRTAMRPSPER